MRPRERREMKIAQGDPRARLLANALPAERSEVAARYDHQREIDEMYVGDFLDDARRVLTRSRRVEAMLRGHDAGTINLRLEQLLARVDRGVLPAHIEATITALTKPVTDEEVFCEASRMYGERCDYLKRRYGVEHTPPPRPEY